MRLFFYGTLLDQELRRLVIGRDIAVAAATLTGWRRLAVIRKPFPMIDAITRARAISSSPPMFAMKGEPASRRRSSRRPSGATSAPGHGISAPGSATIAPHCSAACAPIAGRLAEAHR